MIAVDYKGQRQRELFYTENREEAENRYIEAQRKVNRFGEEKGLKVTEIKHNRNFYTTFADGNQKKKPYTGAKAELSVIECDDYFLDLANYPVH